MRIVVYSDLHTEFKPFDYPLLDADILILAGDIHLGHQGIKSTLHLADHYAHVIYIFGNHEYYNYEYPKLTDPFSEARDLSSHEIVKNLPRNYHVLDGSSLELVRQEGNVRFLGSTLWTDFNLGKTPVLSRQYAAKHMNDYRIIYNSEELRTLTPEDTQREHVETVKALNELLDCAYKGKTVIITHHAPHSNSLNHDRGNHPELDPAYASDLSSLITKHTPELWIHGHTHKCEDYYIGPTRVISNQRGYVPYQPVHDFNPNLIIEV